MAPNPSKGRKVLLAVVIILLLAGLVYLLSWRMNPTIESGSSPDLTSVSSSSPEVTATTTESSVSDNQIVYKNNEYGFQFVLPKSWEGYTVFQNNWQGEGYDSQTGETTVYEEGPLITIRDPRWTAEVPRQDIPIMVFTISQWNDMSNDRFHIGAAPINPSELGRNGSYVFALPARYNYAFPEGYQEVDDIIASKPLSPLSN